MVYRKGYQQGYHIGMADTMHDLGVKVNPLDLGPTPASATHAKRIWKWRYQTSLRKPVPAPMRDWESEKPKPRLRLVTDTQRATALANWSALGTLCKTAVAWCAVPEFQAWIGATTALEAGEKIKELCEVESRKELDTDERAGQAFRLRVIAPYQKHMQARGA